ncbi:MAG: M81 family metallopeptidase [Pirellulaceae bacterium]
MRFAAGGICHETSTFAHTRTTVREFETGFGIYRGTEMFDRFAGTNNCTGGFIDETRAAGAELVPLMWAFAYPSGLIPQSDYRVLRDEFLGRLRDADAAGRLDGVLLDLHGAMVVEGAEDGDGDLIGAVREVMGPDRPIVVTFDLHGNHTRRRVELADAIVGFDTYPHVDMAERGREAARLIAAICRGAIRPVMTIQQLPFFWSAACQVTAHPPIRSAFERLHEWEQRPGILSMTLATGFPWADVSEMGPSVIVVADRDPALADRTAAEFAEWIWERRQEWYAVPMTPAQSLEMGEQQNRFPIMLADQADNTGGGAPGDSTEILRLLLARQIGPSVVLYLVDPAAAQLARELGRGARIRTQLGGKSDAIQGPPVDFDGEVVALSEGRFRYDGPMYAGLTGDLGPSAWLRSGNVNVVVVSATMQPLDQAFARSLGIDCSQMRYIVVKSAVHFRSGFEQLGGQIFNVNARAIHSHDFGQLAYRRARPMYPLASPAWSARTT